MAREILGSTTEQRNTVYRNLKITTVLSDVQSLKTGKVERRVRRQSKPSGYLAWCLANSSGVNLPALT